MTLRDIHKCARRSSRMISGVAALCALAVFFAVTSPIFAQGDGSAKLRVVKPFIGYGETFQWSDVPEIIPSGVAEGDELEYVWATDLFFEKQIWQLQFSYKNVRTIDVDYPTADGKIQTKRVWYLVYSVTNTGKQLRAVQDTSIKSDVSRTIIDNSGKPQKFEHPSNNISGVYRGEEVSYAAGDKEGAIDFVPRFVFATASIQPRLVYERGADGLFYGQKRGAEEGVYYDTFDALAFAKIVKKEARRGQNFLDSTRISNHKILPGETLWGVATWSDVDPRVDKFAVYISGLTNALRWELTDEAGAEQVGSGREVWRKVLKINFYTPGDEAHSGQEIYNNLPGELDYEWVYL